MSASVQGFLLLTLPNCTVTLPTTGSQTGFLALQCVTLDVPLESNPERDVWLVLKLNSFEMVVSPTQVINFSRSMHTYMFLPEDESAGPVQLTVPPDPSNPLTFQDLETMEVILSQYGAVHDMDAAPAEPEKASYSAPKEDLLAESGAQAQAGPSEHSELKGHLVLMDEDDGQVVATLDDAVPIKEDKSLASSVNEKGLVVIDLPGEKEEMAGRREAYARPASAEDQDMLMKTAGLISRGIIFATSALASGMTSASNYYISHSTPATRPVEFSPRTRANMRRIHKISGTAVAVTVKTTGTILKTLDHVAGRLGGPSTMSAGGNGNMSQSRPPPPPLPERPSSHGLGAPPKMPGSPPTGYVTPRVGSGGLPAGAPRRLPPRRPRLLNRLLASTDLLVTTLERSAETLIASGTDAVSASLAHKYGRHMGDASRMAGGTVRNVGLVYIDMRGVGRRALLKRAGKAVTRARMGGRDVVLGPQIQAGPFPEVPPGMQQTPPPRYSPTPPSVKGSAPGDSKR